MARSPKTKCIGILTAGGDCPGLNAAIRGVVKAAIGTYGIKVIGILDGFRGLVENRTIRSTTARSAASSPTAGPCSAPAATSRTRCRWAARSST